MADSLKFIVWTNGDGSVGIPGERAEVVIDGCYPDNSIDMAEHIANVREELTTCFGNIWGEKPHVATTQELEQQHEPD